MSKILIVEDEIPIASFMQTGLTAAGYDCACVHDGLTAADRIEQESFDLILLDVMLPGADGFELMDLIRPMNIPVIFITARSAVSDRVTGLRLGADDYLVKPFELIELIARIEAVLRRHHKGTNILSLGDVAVHLDSRRVLLNGQSIDLTNREYELLVFFLKNRDMALFRDTIYERVWQGEYSGDTRTIDLHVLRLRRKLHWEERLVTVNRIGYRLNSEP
ncbi:MAG: response regulator transcription factor [Clostridia bacterium]|nr:response regulator transcription factor [Clostridia bacterium]